MSKRNEIKIQRLENNSIFIKTKLDLNLWWYQKKEYKFTLFGSNLDLNFFLKKEHFKI